jgi:hypothetical protein
MRDKAEPAVDAPDAIFIKYAFFNHGRLLCVFEFSPKLTQHKTTT